MEHLHERYIICRGVKPEDCVVDSAGHMKAVDMGLIKFTLGKTYTTCGTPDYFAPEVIKRTGHSKAYDWWAVGVLLFELMFGQPPFESQSPVQVYQKILKGIENVPFPKSSNEQTINIVQELLKPQPDQRLPMRKGGVRNLKNHPWFKAFDWSGLLNQTLKPPHVPKVNSAKDMSNFSAREKDRPPSIEYIDDGDGWDKDLAWTYTPATPAELDEDNPEMAINDVDMEDNPNINVGPLRQVSGIPKTFSSADELEFFAISQYSSANFSAASSSEFV